MTKKELRKIYLKKRMDLSEGQYEQLNRELSDHFFKAVTLSGINVLHTFLPIKRTREVNTWHIIERIKKDHPHVKVSVPKINNQTSELEHYFLESPDQLKNNTWEIPEPVYGIPTPTVFGVTIRSNGISFSLMPSIFSSDSKKDKPIFRQSGRQPARKRS